MVGTFWGKKSIYFLRTDSRNNFESWQKDVVSHFRFDIGKDHFGGAQNENGPNSSVELTSWNWSHCCQLSILGKPKSWARRPRICLSKNPGWSLTFENFWNPKLETRNPESEIRNPKPETPNLKPWAATRWTSTDIYEVPRNPNKLFEGHNPGCWSFLILSKHVVGWNQTSSGGIDVSLTI